MKVPHPGTLVDEEVAAKPREVVLQSPEALGVGSQPFKIVYFLVVKVPFMVLHGLHYLMVPHPLEEVVKKYEEVRSRRGAVDYGWFAQKMAKARYNRMRDGIPAWWKSKNWEKRLRDMKALRGRVQSEKDVAKEFKEEFRTDHRQEN